MKYSLTKALEKPVTISSIPHLKQSAYSKELNVSNCNTLFFNCSSLSTDWVTKLLNSSKDKEAYGAVSG
jgi:hypothetical protein